MPRKNVRFWFNLVAFGLGVFALVSLVGIAWVSYNSAQRYVHPPRFPRPEGTTPQSFGIPYRDVRLATQDGVVLAAWYTPPQNGALILLAHGYGGVRSAEWFAFFARQGYGVLAWDLRAHGESGGEVCTFGVQEVLDVAAALEFALRQPGVKHIGAWGESLGAATILIAAARLENIEAVVSDSAFATLEEVMELNIPQGIFLPFIRFFAEWETGVRVAMVQPLEHIRAISPRPVFLIQGEADASIPQDSAWRLYQAAGEPRFLWTAPGVGHVGMHRVFPEEYRKRVIGFFDEYLLSQP